ncbi:MAG: hypothetical protein WDN69_03420 [Aliidongia sp.]
MKRIETGRLAVFVGGAQNIDAIADPLDGDAASREAPDIVQAERCEFHCCIASQ